MIYFGTREGLPIGPYHPSEIGAQQRAKQMLKINGAPVYRVHAKDMWEARDKIDQHLKKETSA